MTKLREPLPHMERIACNHVNFKDERDRVYCRRENEIFTLDVTRCGECDCLFGGAQGDGIECWYEDVIFNDQLSFIVESPEAAFERVNALIDGNFVDRIPLVYYPWENEEEEEERS